MDSFDYTLRFDDENHQLTAKNGLSIELVANLLLSLNKALSHKKGAKVVLSEIRGNCYALNLTTNSISTYENIVTLHKHIEDNDYSGFTQDEKNYASTLRNIIAGEYSLTAYSDDKKDFIEIDQIILPEYPEYYFEVDSISGILTSIGGKTIDGKSSITIDVFQSQINISKDQEVDLIQYFKSKVLNLTILKKIRFDDDKIISASLESFEVMSDKSFLETVSELNNGNGIFNDIQDSVEVIRNLR